MPDTTRTSPPLSSDRPVAIVAGATSGMGLAIALDLSTTHDVLAVGRTAATLPELRVPGIRPVAADLTDPQARAMIAAQAERVDVVVHAAALGQARAIDDTTPDVWQDYLALNLVAPSDLTRLLLPQLRLARGTVVFIGSGASTKPVPGSAVYTATKHALRGFADVLRIDEAAHGIRVATVAPGQTDTPMLRQSINRSGTPYEPERYITVQSVARAVRFVVDAGEDVHLTDVAVRPRTELG
ncbi:SDR family oxidoreductase [Microbacterium allomyrinae]|uniref:SDR family oxidoreductase n=1 Tax=Microbacterium allomyrinae TaxID=2830666 RepID=A0A9X1LTP0_9MICO|nr:SDR family oxidoreductase [Microbacterium allomyrinae]MCC2031563.1 SDR family oxidoreductase [Microbacterium allomyrinae]